MYKTQTGWYKPWRTSNRKSDKTLAILSQSLCMSNKSNLECNILSPIQLTWCVQQPQPLKVTAATMRWHESDRMPWPLTGNFDQDHQQHVVTMDFHLSSKQQQQLCQWGRTKFCTILPRVMWPLFMLYDWQQRNQSQQFNSTNAHGISLW